MFQNDFIISKNETCFLIVYNDEKALKISTFIISSKKIKLKDIQFIKKCVTLRPCIRKDKRLMKLFDKIFGNSKDKTTEEKSPYGKEITLPLDEHFVVNFKDNGGIFVYCETMQEVMNAFDGILGENIKDAKISCLNKDLYNLFSVHFEKFFTDKWEEGTIFLTECEYLIAFNGSILMCSNQFAQKRTFELPQKMVVFAKASQIVEKLDDAMTAIKKREKFPTNITTLENFGKKENYRSYGSRKWKMYLILLEDLT